MSDETLTAWCQIVASRNYGFSHYRASVIDGLISEGSSVKYVKTEKGYAKAFSKTMKLNRDDALSVSAQNTSNASDKTEEEIKALSEQTSLKNKTEHHELEKGRVKQKYGLDVTPELVLKDKDGWGEKLRHHYRINHGFTPCTNFGNLPMIDVLEQLKSKFDDDGIAFTPDVANRHKGARLAVILKDLGIDYILGLDFLRGDDPTLSAINDVAIERRKEIKIVAGISIGQKNTPIQTAQSLLNILGLKSPLIRCEGARGERVRIYGKPCPDYERSINASGKQTKPVVNPDTGNLIPIWDERDSVFSYWLENDLEKIKGLRTVYDHEQTIIAKARADQAVEDSIKNQQSIIDLKAIQSVEDYEMAVNQWGVESIIEELPKQLSDDHDQWQRICDWGLELTSRLSAQAESMAFKFVQFTRNAFNRGDKVTILKVENDVENPDLRINATVSYWASGFAICDGGWRINEGDWVGVFA
jgi:hypothetical protein